MTKLLILAALVVSLIAGGDAEAAAIQRGALAQGSLARSVEVGVAVWRGPRPVEDELAGAASAQRVFQETNIIIDLRSRPRRFLRTQGFYSGYPTSGRRFTQGFWSGPVDLGGPSRIVVLKRRG